MKIGNRQEAYITTSDGNERKVPGSPARFDCGQLFNLWPLAGSMVEVVLWFRIVSVALRRIPMQLPSLRNRSADSSSLFILSQQTQFIVPSLVLV
jgi:hypothetical protein